MHSLPIAATHEVGIDEVDGSNPVIDKFETTKSSNFVKKYTLKQKQSVVN